MPEMWGWMFDSVDEVWRRTPWFCGECGSAQGAQVHVPGRAMGATWVEGTDYYECTDCRAGGVRYFMSAETLKQRKDAIAAEEQREAARAPFAIFADGSEVFADLGGHKILVVVVGYHRLVNASWSLTGLVRIRVTHRDDPLMLAEGARLSVAASILSPARDDNQPVSMD